MTERNDQIRVEKDIDRRLAAVEQALWGTQLDPEAGMVHQVRRLLSRMDLMLVGVVVAIVTPAITILLTKAAG